MSVELFFTLLATKIASAAGKITAYFKHPDDGIKEASPESIVKFGKLKAAGDVSIINVNLNVKFEPGPNGTSKADKDEILAELAKLISTHKVALGLEDDFETTFEHTSRTPLTDTQSEQLKLFKKAGWSSDKINSVQTAFRLINLEDSGKFKIANIVKKSAFSGRKEVLNRKLYNLARSGYTDRFAMDLMFSPLSWTDIKMNKILEHFPDAVFVDGNFIAQDMVGELLGREKEEISHVTLYARGETRIRLMEEGYNQYMTWKVEQAEANNKREVNLFWFDRKQQYTIADSNAESIDLYRKALVLRDFN